MIMFKYFLFLTVAILSSNVFAQEIWEGYKPVDKVKLPYAKVAQEMVLQIKTVTIREGESYDVVNTDDEVVTKSKKKLNSDIFVMQIETCRNQGLKRCPLLNREYGGTAVVNNGRELYSCRHMVHNWATVAAIENGLSVDQIVPVMMLLDHKKNVLYNSALDKGLVEIAAINNNPKLNFVIKDFLDSDNNKTDLAFKMSDWVALKANFDLVEPVARKIRIPGINEKIYMSGYPSKTEIFGGPTHGDTAGNMLVSSSGIVDVLALESLAFRTSALSTGGISGGLVSDSKGDVLGLVCASPDYEKGNVWSQAFTIDTEAHRRAWSVMQYAP